MAHHPPFQCFSFFPTQSKSHDSQLQLHCWYLQVSYPLILLLDLWSPAWSSFQSCCQRSFSHSSEFYCLEGRRKMIFITLLLLFQSVQVIVIYTHLFLLFFLHSFLPSLSEINLQYLLYLLMPSAFGVNVYNTFLSVIRISQVSIFRLSAFFSRLHIFNITFHYSCQWFEPVPSTNTRIAEQFLFLLTPCVASQFRPN